MTTRNELPSMNHRILGWTKRHRAELISVAFVVQILASPLADRDPHAGAVLALILVTLIPIWRRPPASAFRVPLSSSSFTDFSPCTW
jgi:hypothetical protein